MKYASVIFIAILLISCSANAQTNTADFSTRDSFESLSKSDGNSVMVFNNAYDGIKGTPYLHKTWLKGSVTMRAGNNIDNMLLKYDMMADNVLVKDQSGKEIFPNHGSVREFFYQDSLGAMHQFINLSITEKGHTNELKGFYELLYQGQRNLYIKQIKYLKHISSKGAYSSNKSYDEFRDRPVEYILLDKNNELVKFSRGKKNVLSALNDNGDLATYVKKKKLNLKKDKDIVSLLSYIDSSN